MFLPELGIWSLRLLWGLQTTQHALWVDHWTSGSHDGASPGRGSDQALCFPSEEAFGTQISDSWCSLGKEVDWNNPWMSLFRCKETKICVMKGYGFIGIVVWKRRLSLSFPLPLLWPVIKISHYCGLSFRITFKKKNILIFPHFCCRSSWGQNPWIKGSYSFRSTKSEAMNVWAADLASPLINADDAPVSVEICVTSILFIYLFFVVVFVFIYLLWLCFNFLFFIWWYWWKEYLHYSFLLTLPERYCI